MSIKEISAAGLILIAALLLCGSVSASDWSQYGFDLETVARKARDQAFAAQEMTSRKSELESMRIRVESARDDLENCRANPDIYDFLDDGCQSYYYEYESAVDEYNYSVQTYNSSLELFEMGLDDFRRALRALEYSCGASF